MFKSKKLLFFCCLLFLALLPLSLSIEFKQNDEWVYYLMVENFLKHNFILQQNVSATFYLQGMMGMIFALIFGISKLPVLTLLVSVLTFYIFCLALFNHYGVKPLETVILGLFLLLNPIFVYSGLGFMTENYFMLFFVSSLYFLISYNKRGKLKDLILTDLFIILAYFVRQFSFITLSAFVGNLLFRKKYKTAFNQSIVLVFLLFFNFYVFPQTPEMYDGRLNFSNLSSQNYIFSTLFSIIINSLVFIFPLVLIGFFNTAKNFIKNTTVKQRAINFSIIFIVIFLAFFSYNRMLNTKFFRDVEFPYMGNIFEVTGFFPKGPLGDKYEYLGQNYLFPYLDVLGKFSILIFLIILIVNYKKFTSYYFLFIANFLILLLVSPVIYDRYILPLIPIFILLLYELASESISKISSKLFMSCFLLGLLFLMYQFSMEFILTKNYIWTSALNIVKNQRAERNSLNVGNSWIRLYGVGTNIYYYSYTMDVKKREKGVNYKAIGVLNLKFPFSFYIDPKIYLIKKEVIR